jgi:hypothetical protein
LDKEDRKILLVQYIQEAVTEGARVKKACECLELSYRSYLRWKQGFTVITGVKLQEITGLKLQIPA